MNSAEPAGPIQEMPCYFGVSSKLTTWGPGCEVVNGELQVKFI